jgi:hypothetical protein
MDNIIYKYRKLYKLDENNNPILNENTLRLIKDGEVYLSDPKKFNDPFDSIIDVTVKGSNYELRQYLLKLGTPDGVVLKKIKSQRREDIYKEILNRVHQIDFLRVFCLATSWNKILMWSHYAQEHLGVCVGIKTHQVSDSPNLHFKADQILIQRKDIDPRFMPALSVDYKKEKPKQLNLLRDELKDLDKFVRTKYEDWKYEEERRVVIPNTFLHKNPISLASSQISEVIFGLRTPDSVIQLTMDKLVEKTKIRYYKIVNKSEYLLERNQIDPSSYLSRPIS